MGNQDIVVIGASAGGIEACHHLLKLLPPEFPAAIFIVIHLAPQSPSVLAKIFSKNSQISVKNPVDGEKIQFSQAYVAPANYHLMLKPGLIRLGRGPRENGARPSVDALFRTAAYAYGERVVGIVLSGALSDGTAGLMAIKMNGGKAIAQNPEESTFSSMPQSAIEFADVDYILKLDEIAKTLITLNSGTDQGHSIDSVKDEGNYKYERVGTGLRDGMTGALTGLTCPSCGGAIWMNDMGRFKEFKCHVGHIFTPQSMLQEQTDAIDAAFWKSLRRVEENIEMRKRLAHWAREENRAIDAVAQEAPIKLAERQAEFIRRALISDVARLSDSDDL